MKEEYNNRRTLDAKIQGILTSTTLPDYPRQYYLDSDLTLYAYVDVNYCISKGINKYDTVWYDIEGVHSWDHLTYDELVECLNNLFLSELFDD